MIFMNVRLGLLAAALAIGGAGAGHALSIKECSARYKDAKTADTLNGQDWKTFRATQCGATAAATPAAATPAATTAATAPTPTPTPTSAPHPGSPTAAAPPVTSGPAVFPNAISPKYASETPGKGRLHTCLDQYRSNKADNGNGGMHWIQKGGGYYSECSKHLKG